MSKNASCEKRFLFVFGASCGEKMVVGGCVAAGHSRCGGGPGVWHPLLHRAAGAGTGASTLSVLYPPPLVMHLTPLVGRRVCRSTGRASPSCAVRTREGWPWGWPPRCCGAG